MKLAPRSIQAPDEWLAVWLAMAVLVGLFLAAAAWLVTRSAGVALAAGLAVGGGLALAGVRSSGLSRRGATWWNRVARGVARRLSAAVLAIAFYCVVWPAGRPGARRLRDRLEGQAGWRVWDPRPGTGTGFAGWSAARGEAWVVFLLPFFWLLRAFGARPEGAAPEGIYTLF